MPEIFDYYLKVIFCEIISEIKNYQVRLDIYSKKKIKEYYKTKHVIGKKDFAYAIRLFITLILFLEDKESKKKIKNNSNNIIKYLKSQDFWKKEIFDDDNFNNNLSVFKSMNFHINQMKDLYETLDKVIERDFFKDVKDYIEDQKKKQKSDEEEEEDEDIKKKKVLKKMKNKGLVSFYLDNK